MPCDVQICACSCKFPPRRTSKGKPGPEIGNKLLDEWLLSDGNFLVTDDLQSNNETSPADQPVTFSTEKLLPEMVHGCRNWRQRPKAMEPATTLEQTAVETGTETGTQAPYGLFHRGASGRLVGLMFSKPGEPRLPTLQYYHSTKCYSSPVPGGCWPPPKAAPSSLLTKRRNSRLRPHIMLGHCPMYCVSLPRYLGSCGPAYYSRYIQYMVLC